MYGVIRPKRPSSIFTLDVPCTSFANKSSSVVGLQIPANSVLSILQSITQLRQIGLRMVPEAYRWVSPPLGTDRCNFWHQFRWSHVINDNKFLIIQGHITQKNYFRIFSSGIRGFGRLKTLGVVKLTPPGININKVWSWDFNFVFVNKML